MCSALTACPTPTSKTLAVLDEVGRRRPCAAVVQPPVSPENHGSDTRTAARQPHGPGDSTIRFSLLGPVRVWRAGDELLLGPKQQRLILAVLLARAGRPVSMEEFVDLLWEGDPPSSATNAVHRYVGALRRLLEPDLPTRSAGRWLARQAGGYALRVDARSLDLLDFRAVVDRARQAEAAGDPGAAVELFTAALKLRQGRSAADLEPAVSRHPAFVMLEHEYASVVGEAAEAAMLCGLGASMLMFLRQAAEQHPLDESLQGRLLLALAADGKQAEAIALYEQLCRRLMDELGVRPGAELQNAYERILHHRSGSGTGKKPQGKPVSDQAPVKAGSSPPGTATAEPARPAQLPPNLPGFVGREDALRQGAELAARAGDGLRVLAVDGMAGIGKTALALHFAHGAASDFPDGQLYADLRGFAAACAPADPADVLDGFLEALGIARERVPASLDVRSALYRSALADRRVLVVLDNAHDLAQVKPLLPGTSNGMVIVTSRSRLTGLASGYGAHLLTLDVPSPTEASQAFLERVRLSRPDAREREVGRLVERCGRLPIALAVVAAKAAAHPERTLLDIDQELADTGETLDAFNDDNLDNDVRDVFALSYRTLGPQAARIFRLVGLHRGPDVSIADLADMAGVPVQEVECAVGELVRARLVNVRTRQRYWMHGLLRAYAAELARGRPLLFERTGLQVSKS